MSGNVLTNFDLISSPYVDPYWIKFSTVQTEAAFAIATNAGTSTFTARLNGNDVESFSAFTHADSTSNFFGFTGITFDEIRVDVGGANSAMILDNLQLGDAVTSTPEPTSMALLGLASLGGIGLRWRLRRKSQDAQAAA